jgi:hypothetical protein
MGTADGDKDRIIDLLGERQREIKTVPGQILQLPAFHAAPIIIR